MAKSMDITNEPCSEIRPSKMRGKVYFYGLSDGSAVKIGYTSNSLGTRKSGLIRGQFNNVDLYLLAAVNGTRTHEAMLHRSFTPKKAGSTELFLPSLRLIEYINWIRQQWWAYLSEDDNVDEVPSLPEWQPTPERRVPYSEEDPSDLIPRHRDYCGPLAGTPWDRLCTPTKTGDDFYTPAPLVDAARTAMGGIDLDAASHWQANRIFRIRKYYHIHLSAFDNPWEGRVWLNPPYGDNKPWFEQILKYYESQQLTQLCMLSPVWVFNTLIAKPIMNLSTGMVLLSPTPSFWGHPAGRTGTNHPHAVVYVGLHREEFLKAFEPYGIPMRL